MDIKKLSVEQQKQWLEQRGWQPHPDKPNVYIDPNTRMNCLFSVALDRALADCRLAADSELWPRPVHRRD
jgi:hypothetical protein